MRCGDSKPKKRKVLPLSLVSLGLLPKSQELNHGLRDTLEPLKIDDDDTRTLGSSRSLSGPFRLTLCAVSKEGA